MATMIRVLGNKKLWLACAALAIAVAVWVAAMPETDAVVIAGPGVWKYYSNASYTTIVGARGTGCCGTVIHWGVTTQYKRFERIYCLDVLCPN
jgi:hypothetical protein